MLFIPIICSTKLLTIFLFYCQFFKTVIKYIEVFSQKKIKNFGKYLKFVNSKHRKKQFIIFDFIHIYLNKKKQFLNKKTLTKYSYISHTSV